MGYADQLLAALRDRAQRRRRLDLDLVWAAFNHVCPHLRGRATARVELRQLVDELAHRGTLRLPLAERLFDRVQQPPLPRWVELAAPARAEDIRALARAAAWHPALAFVAQLRTLTRPELDALHAIQRFLAAAAPTAPPLTVRERSLLLLGDEKRLEVLARGRLFGPGRLTYSLLRAREVHPPFVYRDLGHGDRALVIENKDTFCSAVAARARLGRNGAAGGVRWVVFGAGNAILQTYPSLLEWDTRPMHVAYFGDIDTDGLEILAQLGAARHRWPQLPAVTPCEPLYVRLVARASALGLTLQGRPCPPERAETLSSLFSPPLRQAVAEVVRTGGRWPQEAVTEADLGDVLGWTGAT